MKIRGVELTQNIKLEIHKEYMINEKYASANRSIRVYRDLRPRKLRPKIRDLETKTSKTKTPEYFSRESFVFVFFLTVFP